MSDKQRILGVFTLTMINVAAIQSLRNLPVMAEVGWSLVFFYVIAALGFFIPSALVSAELATGWPSTGGIYTWVKVAFGARLGFLAIWLQWIENVIWYPTVLSFTAATLTFLFQPELAENKIYILAAVLVIYWLCTLIDSLGMKASGMISTLGVILGTLIPGIFIIWLGWLFMFKGGESQIIFSFEALLPDFSKVGNMVFLVGVILGFAGMEMSAVHAKEVKNPQKDYPKAIFFSTLIILAVSIFGSLAIAFVVPAKEISLVAGVMQAFSKFFQAYQMPWMTPIMALMMTMGAIAMVATWIIGPSKGLYQTAHEGHLPPYFHKKNRHGMPVRIMMVQGMIVTLLSSAFLFMPTVSSSYWILNDLTALLYLLMYMLLFATGIKLRLTKPEVKRAYRIPGGKLWGMLLVSTIGLFVCFFSFFIGFIPPSQLENIEPFTFQLFLTLGVLVMVATPLILYSFQKNHWKL